MSNRYQSESRKRFKFANEKLTYFLQYEFIFFQDQNKNKNKDAVWYSLVLCAALAEATNIPVVYENEKNFKKLLVKNKAKLINSLLEHGWGRTGKAQETILVLNKRLKKTCVLRH